MVFSSPLFLFGFLPVALAGWLLLPRRLRLPFLFLVNCVFYGWGEPVYLFLMLAVTAVNYAAGRLIEKRRARGGRGRGALAAALVLSLGALGYFKYAGFVGSILSALPFLSGLTIPHPALPIGISFYTFQAMSYTVDVYRGDTPAQRSPLVFGVYVTLFPQLIAGPIVRYRDVAAQLDGRRAAADGFALGVRRFLTGLSKKVLIANQMGLMWDTLRPLSACSGAPAAWAGLIAYSLQIYFDFSGYSDMAIGMGRMLGFSFAENFDYPYQSRSVTEFWRRWHISLSGWFRDYVYIPLGGNRVRPTRHVFNLLAVWTLTGLWHGASWNFVLWGLYYGALLILEKYATGRWLRALPAGIARALTLLLVTVGWVVFSNTDFAGMGAYLGHLAGVGACGLADRAFLYHLRSNLVLLILSALCCGPGLRQWQLRLSGRRPVLALALMAGLMLACVACLVYGSYNPFLYFRF